MKSENFIVIQGWMCNELGLKGNELLVFALIYGFSQDGISEFSGGRRYIGETFDITLPTVDKILQSLIQKNFIAKQSANDYTHTDSYYVTDWVNEGVGKKLYEGSKKTLRGGGKEILPYKYNNKEYNNKTSIKNTTEFLGSVKKSKKLNLYDKCIAMINDFTDDTILQEMLTKALQLFIKNAKEQEHAFYTNNFKGKLNTLKKLSEDNYRQREIVKQTIDNGWCNFYALKQSNKFSQSATVNSEHETEEDIKKRNEFLARKKANGERTEF